MLLDETTTKIPSIYYVFPFEALFVLASIVMGDDHSK
jgi:hypothetical protein